MNNNVYLKVKGEYQDTITHSDGRVEITKSHNLIVDDIYKLIAILLGRRTGYTGLQFWAVGKGLDTWSTSNTPDPSEEDTQLVNEIGRVPITRMYHVTESHQETNKVTNRLAVEVTFGKDDCVGTWREFGIFGGGANAERNSGIMINHKTHGAIKKTNEMEITRKIVFTFTNGLTEELPEDLPQKNPSDYQGLIINQIYGGGVANDNGTSVTHSFIELYNNSEKTIDLEGLSVQYGTKGTNWHKLDLEGEIPSHHSFLIRGNRHSADDSSAKVIITEFDAEFDVLMHNKATKVALLCSTDLLEVANPIDEPTLIDLVGACDVSIDGYETKPLEGLSKQKSARRKNFADTNDNSVDFEIIDYRVEDNLPYAPKTLSHGAWQEVVFPEPEPEPEPEEDEMVRATEIPRIYLGENVSGLTSTSPLLTDFRFVEGNGQEIFSKKAVIEFQSYDEDGVKQNYSFDLLEMDGDTKYKPSLKRGFSKTTWVPQDGYHLKANVSDVTHARNIVGVNLVRESYTNPITVARACVDGFPVEVYIGEQYHGLYTWNLKQHRDVYGLGKPTTEEKRKHLMFRGKWSDSDATDEHIISPVNFRALSTDNSDTGADNRDWEDRHPKAYKDYSNLIEPNRSHLNRLITFVKDTHVDSFKNKAPEYFNVEYLIDYYVWSYFGGFTDSLSNNLNIVSYDSQIWYTTFYDLDACFGINHKGDELHPTDLQFPTGYRCATSLLWEKVGVAFRDEIKERYAELRRTTMNPTHILKEFKRFEYMIPEEAYARDLEKWSTLNGREYGFDTIKTWLEERVKYCDPIFEYTE